MTTYSVIYYRAADGECDVKDFLNGLQSKARAKCFAYIKRLRDGPPLPTSHAKHLDGRIWELRPEWGGTEYRILYARLSGRRTFVLLVAFTKKRWEVRPEDIDKAKRRLTDYESRNLA
ncbi:MAG: type II toxin-antitoxin system RelE/ParE family toxin [Dehalococcoidia bacterium]